MRKPGIGRSWIVRTLIAFTASGAFSVVRAAETRPDILFIIADDWSYPHAGIYGDRVVKTPNFDRIAAEGMIFSQAYCSSPSCTPSRGAILTGRPVHQLEAGGNLWSALPSKFVTYPDRLAQAGYRVAFEGKGWSPGSLEGTGREQNPAGPRSKSFAEFLADQPTDQPFCYWYGSFDPHRPYDLDSGVEAGMAPDAVTVPGFLPDDPITRRDVLDYYVEVQRYDTKVGELLAALDKSGRADRTIVVVTSDNGMPFPRAKANLYDYGTRMPLAIRWPGKVQPGSSCDAFVGFIDFAPTFLDAAGVAIPSEVVGRSLVPILEGKPAEGREAVFVERERHANVRKGDLSYPCRAIRTSDWLYIRNLRPDRWPAGDPELYFAVGPFGDVDGSPSKALILDNRTTDQMARYFDLAFAKRPAEELYNVKEDPYQLHNLAGSSETANAQADLRRRLDDWMTRTGDPLSSGDDEPFDHYRYFGNPEKKATGAAAKVQAKP